MIAIRGWRGALALALALGGAADAVAQGRGGGRFPGRGPWTPGGGELFERRDPTEIIIDPGRVTPEIACAADRSWTWRLYVPANFSPDQAWPVLFVVSPGGANASTLRRFTAGAELNGFLLVAPVQAGKTGKDDRAALDAVMRDVADRLPTDHGRLFLAGFAEGARLVLAAAAAPRDLPAAGLLISGDGDPALLHPSTLPLYALCGTNSPRRREVARMFDPPGNPEWRLEYFAGGHEWAGDDDLAIGLTWLNAATLRRETGDVRLRQVARERLTAALVERVRRLRSADPERAHDWADGLTLLTTPASTAPGVLVPHPLALELRNDPRVKKYREGHQEMVVFGLRFFGGTETAGTPGAEAVLAAHDLAFRYRDSRLRPIFERMGQAASRAP